MEKNNNEKFIEVPNQVMMKYPNAFALEVSDDTMNRIMLKGSIAIIDPSSEIVSGDVVAVGISSTETVIRRVRLFNNSIVLEPESHNPVHTPKKYSFEKGECNIKIFGKLVWFMPPLNVDYKQDIAYALDLEEDVA